MCLCILILSIRTDGRFPRARGGEGGGEEGGGGGLYVDGWMDGWEALREQSKDDETRRDEGASDWIGWERSGSMVVISDCPRSRRRRRRRTRSGII